MSTGIILSNIGSPDSTKVSDVRRYLAQFLMDPRVIDLPFLLRALIVYCFVLPLRPRKSAEAYKSVWLDNGSPLVVYTQDLANKLEDKVDAPIELGMRYQNPSIKLAVSNLIAKKPDLDTIVLAPMFPHYAMSTTESIVVYTQKYLKKYHPTIKLKILYSYYNDPQYIDALHKSMHSYLNDYDHILFSYHGVPVRHLKKTDPTCYTCYKIDDCCHKGGPEAHTTCYKAQTVKTTELLVKKSGIPDDKWSIAYQSRLGKDPWIEPATDDTLEHLAKNGVKKLLVMCPAFVTDCLETLEEIAMEGKEEFMENGGESFTYIPCLNSQDPWVHYLSNKLNTLISHD